MNPDSNDFRPMTGTYLHEQRFSLLRPLSDCSPFVIGGVGGSGTRVVAKLLIEAGINMGHDLNDSLDDLSFTVLFKRSGLWPLADNLSSLEIALRIYLEARRQSCVNRYEALGREQIEELFAEIAQEGSWREAGSIEDRFTALLHGIGSTKSRSKSLWGWKEPNSHVVLPYLLATLPNIKYLHVVRNGLQMAESQNQNQLKVWGRAFLGEEATGSSAQNSFDYWCAVQERILAITEQHGDRIISVRYEDIIDSPLLSARQIGSFLGIDLTQASLAEWTDWIQQGTANKGNPKVISSSPITVSTHQKAILKQAGYEL